MKTGISQRIIITNLPPVFAKSKQSDKGKGTSFNRVAQFIHRSSGSEPLILETKPNVYRKTFFNQTYCTSICPNTQCNRN